MTNEIKPKVGIISHNLDKFSLNMCLKVFKGKIDCETLLVGNDILSSDREKGDIGKLTSTTQGIKINNYDPEHPIRSIDHSIYNKDMQTISTIDCQVKLGEVENDIETQKLNIDSFNQKIARFDMVGFPSDTKDKNQKRINEHIKLEKDKVEAVLKCEKQKLASLENEKEIFNNPDIKSIEEFVKKGGFDFYILEENLGASGMQKLTLSEIFNPVFGNNAEWAGVSGEPFEVKGEYGIYKNTINVRTLTEWCKPQSTEGKTKSIVQSTETDVQINGGEDKTSESNLQNNDMGAENKQELALLKSLHVDTHSISGTAPKPSNSITAQNNLNEHIVAPDEDQTEVEI